METQNMNSQQQDFLSKITNHNKIILQILNPDGSYSVEYVKSICDINKKFNIPYSTLINLYYICTNKGGGRNKTNKKKYIHSKYIELLKHIRIFDAMNEEKLHNKDFLNELMAK